MENEKIMTIGKLPHCLLTTHTRCRTDIGAGNGRFLLSEIHPGAFSLVLLHSARTPACWYEHGDRTCAIWPCPSRAESDDVVHSTFGTLLGSLVTLLA